MAAHKSEKYPHQWPDGTWHSVPKAAPAKPAPAASTPAPAAPGRVPEFWTSDDIDAINAFNTDLATKLSALDADVGTYDPATGKWSGGNLETDTTYQKTQVDDSAKKGSSAAQDDAIARGIFRSSLKDANLNDIEAQRSLQAKFLDDKLTASRLNAGTQKAILTNAKTEFDKNMLSRKVSNAQGVNDTNSAAFAAARAAWAAANPGAIPGGGTPNAPGATGPSKGTAPGTIVSKGTPPPKPANQSSTMNGNTNSKLAIATPKKPGKPKIVYGGRG